MRALPKALVVAAALSLALGACGDDDDDSAATSTIEVDRLVEQYAP